VKLDRKKIELQMARQFLNKTALLKCGMPDRTYQRIITGENVRPSTAGRFAALLGVDVTELLQEDQEGDR